MKRHKLFAQVLYYAFTIIIGVMLALFLPYVLYLQNSDAIDIVGDKLESGDYVGAINEAAAYYNAKPVFSQTFDDGGGVVLFESAVLHPIYDSNKNKIGDKLYKSYSGYLFGVAETYEVSALSGNKSKILLTDNEGEEHQIKILNFDTNDDSVNDTSATFLQKGFIFLDFNLDEFSSVKSVKFVDCKNKVFKEITPNLNFSEQFFDDVDVNITKYNAYVDEYIADHTEGNKEYLQGLENELKQLENELYGKNSNYKRTSSSINANVAKSSADKTAAIIVVCYFVVVYIVGDLLVGGRYIIKFFRWFFVKVCKVKVKPKTMKYDESFGHDYYCQLTFALDVSEIPNFSESVQIRYTPQDTNEEDISFILLKAQNYSLTQRIKAGTYVNMWIDLDKTKYATVNLPETLIVEGYQKGYKIKIIKREE